MRSDLGLSVPPARFAWVLDGACRGMDHTFDEDLGRYADAAITPTRGALVAEYLLVVPRTPCLSVSELDALGRARVLAVADDVSARVSARVGAAVIFEHGPGRRGTAVGCGVDQGHLHVVGGAPDLLDRLVDQVDEASWSMTSHAAPWSALPPGSDYLMVRDSRRTVVTLVTHPTSQRLRRALAESLGRGNEWDYRSHPNAENARRTKEIFSGAFADA